MKFQPFIKPEQTVTELTVRSIIIALILTAMLAMANAFLALKIGMLTSASIPAAVISMAVLRFFKNSSVLENNLVQTAASAGEAVAGGIVYTIPALIIIQYWHAFSYWDNFFIAVTGGILGVIFSIPLRRILVHQADLPFPEGKAIAEVLKVSDQSTSIKELLIGGALGCLIELFQTGFKIIANSYQIWFSIKRTLVGFGVGFSATLIGAGYLIGFELGLSIFIGAVLGWVIAIPFFSEYYPSFQHHYLPAEAVDHLWNAKVRYLGIGGMLFAGLWSFVKMIKPLYRSIKHSTSEVMTASRQQLQRLRTEYDIPTLYLLVLASALAGVMFVFFQGSFPLEELGFDYSLTPTIVLLFVFYVFLVGFIFSVITAFFSGLVGVTASPGSSIIIAGMLLLGWLLTIGLNYFGAGVLTSHQIKSAEAITIIIGSIVTGIAAIANDNIQDLKVGYLLGATPWKQQLMLLLGVVVAAMVIPLIMQILFNVYGIAGVMPHSGMDPSLSLPAPPAALMAAITEALFNHGLPWPLLMMGASIMLFAIPLLKWLAKRYDLHLSLLGIAIGIYLPMSSSVPIFIGGLLALIIKKRLHSFEQIAREAAEHKGLLLACGLVAGAALMDVALAIPFSLSRSANVMQLDLLIWDGSALGFAILSTLGLSYLMIHIVCGRKKR